MADAAGLGRRRGSWDAIFRNTGYIQFVLTDEQVTVVGDSAWVTLDENILQARVDVGRLSGSKATSINVFVRSHDSDAARRQLEDGGAPRVARAGRRLTRSEIDVVRRSTSRTSSTEGLESSPVADALAGLRANEARYFKNKYDHVFTVEPASKAKKTIAWVDEDPRRSATSSSRRSRSRRTEFEADGIKFAYVFYESGLSINVMYGLDEGGKRAVGFKLSDGMDVPAELAERFKFARQKSKLRGHHPRLLLRDQGQLLIEVSCLEGSRRRARDRSRSWR